MSFHGGRTATRFLKGRIDRTSNTVNSQKPGLPNDNNTNKENNVTTKPALQINEPSTGQLKLVLKDSPLI